VIQVRDAVIHHPTYDWKMVVSVDGRVIKSSSRKRNNPQDVQASSMVSIQDGKLVEGKLIFAQLVSLSSRIDQKLISSVPPMTMPKLLCAHQNFVQSGKYQCCLSEGSWARAPEDSTVLYQCNRTWVSQANEERSEHLPWSSRTPMLMPTD
jgi:hypothetical protein